ncbi:hypothetical protein H8A99_32540 [Bradyrhizobium sp. Arg68]|uniref:hypothetical protein n=1 Tax=Bradyrhizobium ivorense TaxID=2511166 RepID=UPI001E2A6686|nr:hypothetical protein [Bradyrhizobium ivorense]MCC8941037.1 hypothetical protein [Bradyrhizobium ivorense]
MSEAVQSKRKYVRVDQSTWSEIEAHWETGDVNLQELEARYGVSRRALQSRFSKRGLVKGSKAAQIAAAVKERVFEETLPEVDEITSRAKATREAAYQNAVIVEGLIMAQLEAAQKDASQALRAASAIKALSLAAAGLERIHSLKWRALGLDKDSALSDELPILVFEDLTSQEIQLMQERDRDGDPDDLEPEISAHDEGDEEVIVIDCEAEDDDFHHGEAREAPSTGAPAPKGPRLVRGAT